jgi:hypothetical protein
MNRLISQLDDRRAVDIIRILVQQEFSRGSLTRSPDATVIESLGTQVGATRAAELVKEGDVARSALHFLASEDPEVQRRIEVLIGARSEQFLDPLTGGILLTTAVALILQTKIGLHYDEHGWKFDLSKPTISLKDFKDLVAKLLSWWPH